MSISGQKKKHFFLIVLNGSKKLLTLCTKIERGKTASFAEVVLC